MLSNSTCSHLVNAHSRLEWKLSYSSATEGQTFYISTASGAFILLQMVYSTMSWSPTVQASARFYSPPSNASGVRLLKDKTYSCRGSSLILSNDRLSVSCERMSIELAHFEPVTFKVSFHSEDGDFKLDLLLVSVLEGGHVVEMVGNQGQVNFKNDHGESGFVTSHFLPRCVVSGSVVVNGQRHDAKGFGCFVHAIQHYPQKCGRWNFISLQGEKESLLIYQFEMPDGHGYAFKTMSQLCLVKNERVEMVCLDNLVSHLGRQMDHKSGYSVPSAIHIRSHGRNVSDQAVKMGMRVALTQPLDRIDLLNELPILVRKVIQTFISKPYLYSWCENVTSTICVGDENVQVKGNMFIEISFLAEM